MPIVCVGISHHTAAVALRERLAFSPDDQHDLYGRLDLPALKRESGLGELAVLSTCNRTEIYGAATHPRHQLGDMRPVFRSVMVRERGVKPDDLAPHLYAHRGTDAVRHLCRVASGLDSMVLGEFEILGQVRAAREMAVSKGAAGLLLEATFQAAVRAGRRARAETGIARTPVSVSSEAIHVAREIAGDLTGQQVLIVGTGKMGRLAGRTLRAKGAQFLTVVSRTRRHAEAVAADWGATALAWHHLGAAIRQADVVFCSTGAPHAVITEELVQSAIGPYGRTRPLLFVDIAVPRDVEEGVRHLRDVRVVDMDEVRMRLDGNLAVRLEEVPRVESIIDDEVRRFEEWRHAVELRPLFAAMRSRTAAIRRRELARVLRQLGDVPPEVSGEFERFSRSLVNKLLHEPTRRLRQETNPARFETYTKVARELFGLDEDVQLGAPEP